MRRVPAGLVAGLLVLSTGCLAGVSPGAEHPEIAARSHQGSLARTSGGVAGPNSSQASPVCDAPGGELAKSLGPAQQLPGNPVQVVATPTGGVQTFSVFRRVIYVDTGSQLITYGLSGGERSSFPLPGGIQNVNEISGPVVGPDGSIYLASYYGRVVDKFSSSGRLLWSRDPSRGNPTGLFSVSSSGRFELAVSITQDDHRSVVLSSSGQQVGTFPLVDDNGYVSSEPDGQLLYSGNGYVETLSQRGRLLSVFGSGRINGANRHTGGPYQFFFPGQAVLGPGQVIYTADAPGTFEATSVDGFLEHTTNLGGALQIGNGDLQLAEGRLFFQSGPVFNEAGDGISSVSLRTLQQYFSPPEPPLDTLGWGAGIDTPALGNYFAPGRRPVVTADFNPWWASVARRIKLSYSIESASDITSEQVPAPTTIGLPTAPRRLRSIPLVIPRSDSGPGPYRVQAILYNEATRPPTVLGSTCLTYTIGAPGDDLNLARLPPGAGAGGPADPRGVVLNSELGLNGLRGQSIDWSTFLPNCNPSAPTAAACSSSAMSFAHAPSSYFHAAALALEHHVTYWVQVSPGGQPSLALVENGWWQGDIQALVRYYSSPPNGCSNCAPVTAWEPWNEPNNTGFPDAAKYVSGVLAPFASAIRSVAPSDTIIGGSTIGFPFSWWQEFIASGGSSDLTVAAVHPYTGNNDSFEEWGTPGEVHRLEQMLGRTPLWFTEVGWWSDGSFDFLHQANSVARAMLWQKALDIPVWNYFLDEGSFGNDGISFSLIQTSSRGDDFVKPAALAAMTESHLIAERPYLASISTGIPHVYAMRFGPVGRGSTDLVAIWSDGLATNAVLRIESATQPTVPLTLTSQYGAAVRTGVDAGRGYRLRISGAVTYLAYPARDQLQVRPTVAFGENLALSSVGATATATSGDASGVITGSTTGPGWTSSPGNPLPSITIHLRGVHPIDRVFVDTQSLGSTAPGLRDYVILIERSDGQWKQVATVRNQFRFHVEEVFFTPERAVALRIAVSKVNYGGYYGGGIPPFWAADDPATAVLHAIEIYAGKASPARVRGDALQALPTP